mmetsp:Transcript_6153/g.4891  ORF Transcript_6153/g.4891 Transcript_6153/m.4891 type:complete len:94 (-) Transcript_6153:27-308(-)
MATDRSLRNGMTVFFFFFFFCPPYRVFASCLGVWSRSCHRGVASSAAAPSCYLYLCAYRNRMTCHHTIAARIILRSKGSLEPKWLRIARYVTA